MREPIYSYRITDYDRSLIPNRFVAFLDESVRGPDDWVARSGRSLGHPGWGLVYHMVIARLDPDHPNLIVETGTNVGSTALIIAQAIKDSGRTGLVKTIELDPGIAAEARQRADLAGMSDYIEFHEGDSLSVLQAILGPSDLVDVAFLDGSHFHDHVVQEFGLVHPHLAHDSIVVFDNTYAIAEDREDPRVNGALRTIVSQFGGNLINLPFTSWYTPGLAFWQQCAFTDMTPPVPGSFDPDS